MRITGVGGNNAAMEAMKKKMQEKFFKKADANNDGSISKDELTTMQRDMEAHKSQATSSTSSTDGVNSIPSADKIFEQYDPNGDGALSKDEFDTMSEEMAPPPPPDGKMKGPGGPKGAGGPPPGSGGDSEDSSSSSSKTSTDPADANKNGKVSPEEFIAWQLKEMLEAENKQTNTIFGSASSNSTNDSDPVIE